MKRKVLLNVLFIAGALAIIILAQAFLAKPDSSSSLNKLQSSQVFLSGQEISALYPDDSCLWVGGKDGVKRVDYNTGEVMGYVLDDVKLIYAAGIIRSSDGSMWIGHNDGVTVLYTDGIRKDFKDGEMTGGRTNTLSEIGKCV